MSDLSEKIRALAEKTVANNVWRQRRCFNLIPSESTPSLIVKMCEISDPAGRYAEHRTMKGKEIYFYQGINFIRDVEEAAREAMATYFGCSEVELRPISGQMSNEIVFKAVTKFLNRGKNSTGQMRMRRVMNNDLTKGGHLSSQPMGALYNYVEIDGDTGKEAVTNFPIRSDNPYRLDVDKLIAMLPDVRPDLVIFGKSMFLYPEPVKQVADHVREWDHRPVIMYDMAHVLGLYGAFQEPFQDGADVVTGSTHKTFFGPQRGVVAGVMPKGHPLRKLWLEIKSRAFPGSTSNHHLGTLLGLLVAAYEMNTFKSEYQEQVRRNAKAFAAALAAGGLQVEGDPADGYTETHQVLLRVSEYGTGEELAERLEKNNLVCNYQALPDDESFLNSSGLRLGVQEMTRFGMIERDFEPLADFFAAVIRKNEEVGDEVAGYRAGFGEMKFCLPQDEAADLGARLLTSVFPRGEYAGRFAENLLSIAKNQG